VPAGSEEQAQPGANSACSAILKGLETAMAIKLLIADVDGTLVTAKKTLTQATRDAVDRLREGGVLFSITSGRPPRGMASLVEPLKRSVAVAAFNGGVFVKPDLTTVLAQRTIPSDVARQAVDALLAAGLDVWVYQGAEWYLRDPDAFRVARERGNVGFDPLVIDDLHGVLDAPIKIVGVSEDRALVARAEAALGERLGAEASAARSTPFYLDVTHPEANKGMVVREASRILGIPLDQIATIGDMSNDVPMLSCAGMGIAMGNAGPEVQRVARHVTRSNEEDGFAYAVDAFVLGEPPRAKTPLGLPPRARAALFGLDGVLTQTASLHARAWKELFDHYLRERARASGEPFVPFDAVRDYTLHFDRTPPQDGVRSFLVSRGIELPDEMVRALTLRKGELLVELLRREHVEAYEGAVRYVRAARAAGLRTAVVSLSPYCDEILQSAGIADLFDAHVDGDGGPSAEAWLSAAQAVGVDSEQAVVFEDELSGIAAARTNHFGYVVGVDRTGHAAELRRNGADIVVIDPAVLLGKGPPEARAT
jgi:Cof subfamily protein (haloacid dehalogenase superfamily)/HAD superfamily hydrolase (TIGR01509 family)